VIAFFVAIVLPITAGRDYDESKGWFADCSVQPRMEERKLLDSLGRESVMLSLRENRTALLSSNCASGGLRTISGHQSARRDAYGRKI
jgi:hypothetical protein